MAVINILPKNIAELIAAGEVVDRPASIVKELVENSLDAAASRVTVEIKNGGITYIRVTDNGVGMEKEDIPRAFIRHATSKISAAIDLDSIFTLGFRGEALPSVAAVSNVNVITRTGDSDVGWRYFIYNGEASIEEVGCAVGTTVEVSDLFYNTPARMKFLKKDIAEANAIETLLDRLALANPKVSFEFIRDGQRKLKTFGDGFLFSAARVVLGSETSSQMVEVDMENEKIRVSGLVSKPSVARQTRSMQMFFINSRYVRSKTCESALEEAYKHRLMTGKFPACVLNVQLDPSLIDVNVHPAKLEVRFESERSVYNAVYLAVTSALTKLEQHPIPAVEQKKLTPISINSFDFSDKQLSFTPKPVANQDMVFHDDTAKDSFSKLMGPQRKVLNPDIERDDSVRLQPKPNFSKETPSAQENKLERWGQSSISQSRDVISTFLVDTMQPVSITPAIETESDKMHECVVLGEIFENYIIVSQDDKMHLIDKHAAHERYLYDQLTQRHDSFSNRQLLLSPQIVTLSREEHFVIIENLEQLNRIGIGAEDFGDLTIVVREIPTVLTGCELGSLLSEIAQKIRQNSRSIVPQALEELLCSVCCRSAVMAGKGSKLPELAVLADMVINQNVRFCPHGRPAVITLTKRQIEKMFGRLG